MDSLYHRRNIKQKHWNEKILQYVTYVKIFVLKKDVFYT